MHMNFYSPYPQMTSDAARIPDDVNAKLFMRHSIRFENPPDGNYDALLLTQEGIELAKKIGESIDRPLGKCASSTVKRCGQTVEAITSGMRPDLKKGFAKEKVLRLAPFSSLVIDSAGGLTGIGWHEYFNALQTGDTVTSRGVTVEQEAASILDGIFSVNGEPGTLDLLCSHDCHVVVLASALFNLKTGLDGHDWRRYTEGLFFYGTRDDFTALWRGEEKNFVNFPNSQKIKKND